MNKWNDFGGVFHPYFWVDTHVSLFVKISHLRWLVGVSPNICECFEPHVILRPGTAISGWGEIGHNGKTWTASWLMVWVEMRCRSSEMTFMHTIYTPGAWNLFVLDFWAEKPSKTWPFPIKARVPGTVYNQYFRHWHFGMHTFPHKFSRHSKKTVLLSKVSDFFSAKCLKLFYSSSHNHGSVDNGSLQDDRFLYKNGSFSTEPWLWEVSGTLNSRNLSICLIYGWPTIMGI